MSTALLALIAVVLDAVLGEPKRWHPLVGFGRLASAVEHRLRGPANASPWRSRTRGAVAAASLLVPFTGATWVLTRLPHIGPILSILCLYFALAYRSLREHAGAVAKAMRSGDEDEALCRAGLMVSRDPVGLDSAAVTIESVLENGNDGVFGVLFWFAVAGGGGAVLYRLANTLDAMWGYRTQRYLHFGWAAARFDDLLNYLPARLTAFTFAVLGQTRQALRCWRRQAPAWDSPNAGPVMAAGAGSLGVLLGGPARYAGVWHERPRLGAGDLPRARDIERALALVRRGVVLWLGCLLLGGWIYA